jgi:hypothetical protein
MAEATTEPETLARTLINLGIDYTFLKNGELQQLPRDARGRVVDEMVNQRLNAGRWQSVVEMIWGGVGKADVLYGGSLEELRERIIDSIKLSPQQGIEGRVLEMLRERQESELLYGIAMVSERNFPFDSIESTITPLFADPETGAERKREFHARAADSYLERGNYQSALGHFKVIQDFDGVTDVFEKGLAEITSKKYSEEETKRVVLDAALYSPEHKDERLKRLVLTGLTQEKGISLESAFKLFREHSVPLTEEERNALYETAAERFSRHDIAEWKRTGGIRSEERVDIDPVLSLLWARKHAGEEPDESYRIFKDQDYEGSEVLMAVQRGLEIGLEHPHEEYARSLSPHNVKPEHLRAVYPRVPLRLRRNIAMLLRDDKDFNYEESLQQLSREAEERGNLELAYDCWSLGGGDEKRLRRIRSNLIERDIKYANEERFSGRPSFFFLDRKDCSGYRHAIDALLEASPSAKYPFAFLEKAHELSMFQGTEEQARTIRERMVEIDSLASLRVFMGSSYLHGRREEGEETEMGDPDGFNYALGIIAQQQGTPVDDLRPLVEKYASSIR